MLGVEAKERARAKELVKETRPADWFNAWSYIALIANIFQVLGSGIYLVEVSRHYATNVTIGFGCFFAWVTILRYLQYNPNYFFMFNALGKSLPTVVRFMAGIMPLFLGYAFFATAVFWQSHRFEDLSRTMQTQFALMNGDGILDGFYDLTNINYGLGQIYLYSYIIIFICVVQNLFVAIIIKVYAEERTKSEQTKKKKNKKEEKKGGDTADNYKEFKENCDTVSS